MTNPLHASFDDTPPGTAAQGQLAHPAAIAHGERLARRFYPVGEHAWCLVGNGLSNQTFVRGPAGIIAIDTGESNEEMASALEALRTVTDEPIVAVIYTHFHYVNGTEAIRSAHPAQPLEIYGHTGIAANLKRFGGEIAPRSGRGLVHQFGMMLPDEGPDAHLHCGLGRFYRNPEHAPFTPGYLPATHPIDAATRLEIAGLTVDITPAPSDATDSITIYFPTLRLCVNNLVWPALFNVYAIRGEEYRDPRVVLAGIDHIVGLQPEHLVGTHGPPLSGERVVPEAQCYRDAIQFLWDQTVRGANAGLSLSELTERVVLPDLYQQSYFTQQLYGLVEHHVRQIHAGLFGWFDEREQHLFPLPERERHERLIAGFGGREAVRAQLAEALARKDLRWGVELAAWLVHSDDATQDDRDDLANALTAIARGTMSANVRSWCLTRALALRGDLDLERHHTLRMRQADVLSAEPARFVHVLRVLLDPDRAEGLDAEVAWQFASGERAGLHVRGGVAVPTGGQDADVVLGMSLETWAEIAACRRTLDAAIEEGVVSVAGDEAMLRRVFAAFDHAALNSQ